MKLLFIGARLFDDVAYHAQELGLETIISESNPDAPNLKLADTFYIVPRGMEAPMELALKEDVDAVVPLIGIDEPLQDLARFKEEMEETYSIPVIASNTKATAISCNKKSSKDFFRENKIKTPSYKLLSLRNYSQHLTYPAVLKQENGQGGSGINIVKKNPEAEQYFQSYPQAIMEEFIEGIEISVEVLGWKGDLIPLVPVYKGKTSLQGIHPLDKIRSAPLKIEGLDNDRVRKLAFNITKKLGSEGNTDLDFIFNPQEKELYTLELNTRPSGTRYLTAASTDIHPLNQLIDMAIGEWNSSKVKKKMKEYYSLEFPVGDYQGGEIPAHKNFLKNNSYVVHGPPHYQRVTIRAFNQLKAINMARKLNINVEDYPS